MDCEYERVHTDGNQEDSATFAVTLDDKRLYCDNDDEPAIAPNQLITKNHRKALTKKPNDIAGYQAQLAHVLKILSKQQVSQQAQASHPGSVGRAGNKCQNMC